MSVLKRALSDRRVRAVVAEIAAAYIRLVRTTGRWTIEGAETPERLVAAGRPFIVAFWHGRLLMLPCAWTYAQPMHMVISQHRDGLLISRTIRAFGLATIAGSTSRGGTQVLRSILRALKEGAYVGVTPDGPRGPRMRVGGGVVQAARLAGVPILPLTYAASRRKVMTSWDRFVVALPFARGIIRWSEPIEVPADADAAALEAIRRTLEDRLNAEARALDERVGARPIEPAGIAAPAAESSASR